LKKNLKASVLIANYNNQKFIDECIKSLKKQSYKNLEIIFHDDCSSDDSIKKALKYKNIKIIKNIKRGKYGSYNQIKAYERAFKKSTGEIIFLLDSDDYFFKSKVNQVINFFNSKRNIKVIYDLPIYKFEKKYTFKKNKKKLIKNFWPYIPPQSCISFRREEFLKILNTINFKKFPDIWMDFRLAIYLIYIKKNFFILEKNLTFYRQSVNTVSSKFQFLSNSWWERRKQAHNYVKYFFKKNKLDYRKNLDYFLTSIVNKFL
tara:strand:+ start:265 stop:1047 length:783 start_codon:yes stop_codon:yes gene_type:complete